MSRTRLILNGVAVPLPPDTEIAVTYQAHDIRNIGSRDGAYAETFELPDTAEVRAALGHSNLINSDTYAPYSLIPATLEQDYNTVLTGNAMHTEAGEGFFFEFTGLNADIFERIKGKSLQDIDLSDLDHQYSNLNVTGANTHDAARGYLYPLINYGYWNTRYLDPTNQYFAELYPAVYVSTLLERMAAPYTLAGSLLTDPRFAKLVVPFTNETFRYRESYAEQFTATGSMTGPNYYTKFAKIITFNTYAQNTPGLWVGGKYIVSQRGRYHLKATLNMDMSAPAGKINEIYFSWRDVANNDVHEFQAVEVQAGDNQTITVEVDTGVIPAGDELYLWWFPGGPPSTQNNVYFNAGSTIEITLINEVVPYGITQLDANLPDIPQEELLLTICNMFNVIIQTDTPRKVIRMDLLRDIKNKPGLDWSDKIDFSTKPKHVFTLADYAQNNILGYEAIEEGYGEGVTEQDLTIITVDNERLELEKETYISPFTATYLRPAFRGSQLLPYIPVVAQQVLSFGIWRASINYGVPDYVFYGGDYYKALRPTIGDTPTVSPDDWEQVPQSEVFQFSECTPRLLVVETRSGGLGTIPVGDPGVGGTFSNLNTHGIFEKSNGAGINAEAMRTGFHWITEKMLQDARLLTLKMRLTLSDISQLDFMRPITLNVPQKGIEGAFYLNKVSQFNPTNAASTEVELVRLYGFPVVTAVATEEPTGNLEYSEEYSEEYN